MSLVSVIIPCYNVSSFIEDCLHSVYTQSYQDIEVIVVDNNSSDSTLQTLQKLKNEKYTSLNILQELKPGACAARNAGLKNAKGDWIQFLDADDIIKPNKLEHQMALIKNRIDISFVAGAAEHVDSQGNSRIVKPLNKHPYVSVFVRGLGNTCANFWKTSDLLEIHGWDESLSSSQEADLMFRLLELGNGILLDNEPLTVVNERLSGQISQSNPVKRWENIVLVRSQALQSKFFTLLTDVDKEDVASFHMASLMILTKYRSIRTEEYLQNISQFKNIKLQPKYGLSKKHIKLINILGLKTTLKINGIFTK